MNLGTVSSRQHLTMYVLVSLADGLEYCSDIVRRHLDKNPGVTYSVGNVLCSWAKVGSACAGRALGCVSR
jgi:hypothetical protein